MAGEWGRDINAGLTEYEAGVLTTSAQISRFSLLIQIFCAVISELPLAPNTNIRTQFSEIKLVMDSIKKPEIRFRGGGVK
jgi:hypothetical protein